MTLEEERMKCEECPKAATTYSLSGHHLYCTVPADMRARHCPHVFHSFKVREYNCNYSYTLTGEVDDFISKEEMTI